MDRADKCDVRIDSTASVRRVGSNRAGSSISYKSVPRSAKRIGLEIARWGGEIESEMEVLRPLEVINIDGAAGLNELLLALLPSSDSVRSVVDTGVVGVFDMVRLESEKGRRVRVGVEVKGGRKAEYEYRTPTS